MSAREEASRRVSPQISSTSAETRGVGVTAVEKEAAGRVEGGIRRRRRWRRRDAIRVFVRSELTPSQRPAGAEQMASSERRTFHDFNHQFVT